MTHSLATINTVLYVGLQRAAKMSYMNNEAYTTIGGELTSNLALSVLSHQRTQTHIYTHKERLRTQPHVIISVAIDNRRLTHSLASTQERTLCTT